MNWNQEKIWHGIQTESASARHYFLKSLFHGITIVQKENKAERNTLQGGVVTSIIGDVFTIYDKTKEIHYDRK